MYVKNFNLRESIDRNFLSKIPTGLLRIFSVGQTAVILLGENYGLLFEQDFDFVKTCFLVWDEKNSSVRKHGTSTIYAERSHLRMSAPRIVVSSRADALEQSMQSLSIGLLETCPEVLQGDFSWLHQRIRKDPTGRQGSDVSAAISSAIQNSGLWTFINSK